MWKKACSIGESTSRQNSGGRVGCGLSGLERPDALWPAYGFTPVGVGELALAWAKDNDRKLLDCVRAVSAERVVPEVRDHMNACGGWSNRCMLAAARERGIVEARVLRHANSFEVLAA